MKSRPEEIRASRDVYAVLEGDRYAVHFPYDKEALVAAKKALKNPKYDPERKAWTVLARWHAALPTALDAIEAVFARRWEAEKAKQAEAAAARAKAAEKGRGAIKAMEPFRSGIAITLGLETIELNTAYHPKIVELCRRLDGRFRAGRWILPIAAGVEIAALRDRIRDWHNETIAADRAKAERREACRAARFVVFADGAPEPGAVLWHNRRWVCVESLGKVFIASDDLPSMGGPIGCEGERVRYAYYREARSDEIEAAEAAEAERKARAAVVAARKAALNAITDGEVAPATGREPEGETIWRHDRHALYGYREWVVRGVDGWLYLLTYNGSDGATWGDYNAGYNTHAMRVRETPELVAAITAP